MTVIHFEDTNNKGNTYFEGDHADLVMLLVGSMQASEYIALLIEQANIIFKTAQVKGMNITTNVDIKKIDEQAKKAYDELIKGSK